MQKYKLPIAAGTAIVVLALIYFIFFRSAGVYQAVPASAIAVIEVNNWDRLWDKLGTTGTGSEVKKTAALQKLQSEILVLQQLMNADKALKATIASQNTVASLHLTSATDYDYLFTTLLSGVNDNTLLNHIQSSPLIRSVNVHIFKNQKIVDLQLKDGRQLSFAKQGSILAMSFTTFLTENSMTALSSGYNLKGDKDFKSVTAGLAAKADLKLYFNFQKADVIFPVAFKAQKLTLLQDVKTIGGWGRYDVSFTNGQMELDGVISAAEKEKTETKNILSENLFAKIPDHTAYVQLSRTDTTGNTALSAYFNNWIGDTKAFAILEPLKENYNEQNVLLLSIKNKPLATQKLKLLAGMAGGTAQPVDTFMQVEIYSLADGAILNQVFGNELVKFGSCFYTVSGNAAVFCNNIDVLKLLLEKTGKGETLDKDNNFINTGFSNYSKNTAITYMNFQRSDLLVNGLLQQNSTLGGLLSSFRSVLSISNRTGKKIFSHLTFYSGGQGKASSGLVWKTKLKTEAMYPPQVVLNNTTGEKEIFVQDTANNIYLLSQSGEILFTKNTGEPIIGSVQQLDYYNNGKLQYIFNSASHVFIVDRLGNDVGSYPLRLSSAATAGLTLAKNGSLSRYYLPCANGSLYGYESNGKPLPGWSPKNGTGLLNQPLQHFKYKGADLFIACSTTGKLQLLDARGNVKWTVENLPAAAQSFSVAPANGEFKLLNAAGLELTEISADGNDEISQLIDSAVAFTATSTSDTGFVYYYSNKGQLRAYTGGGEFKASANLAGADITALQVLTTTAVFYLLATDTAAKQLFVFDAALKQNAAFNYGNAWQFAIADLFNRNQFMVITSDKGGSISCYRIQ